MVEKVQNNQTKIEAPTVGGYLVSAAKALDNLKKINLKAWQLDVFGQVLRFAGGLLKTQTDPSGPAKLAKESIKERDYGLTTVMVAKTIIGIATVIFGGEMAVNALLTLSGSKTRLPSLKTFAMLVKIPKGAIVFYSLYHSMNTSAAKEPRETALEKARFKAKFGKAALEAAEKGGDVARAIEKEGITHTMDATLVVGLLTQFVLEGLGQKRAAELLDNALTGVVIVQTVYSAYDTVTDKENQKMVKDAPKKVRSNVKRIASKGAKWAHATVTDKENQQMVKDAAEKVRLSFRSVVSRMRSFGTDSSAG